MGDPAVPLFWPLSVLSGPVG